MLNCAHKTSRRELADCIIHLDERAASNGGLRFTGAFNVYQLPVDTLALFVLGVHDITSKLPSCRSAFN